MSPGQPEGRPRPWTDAPFWLARARRMGPLRVSDLGPRRAEPPTPASEVAAWALEVMDGWWRAFDRPDPYTLVVVSGDDGSLAREVLRLGPECLEALRYVMVDPVPADPAPADPVRADPGPAAPFPGGPPRGEPPGAVAGRLPLEEPAFLYPAGRPHTDGHPDDGPDPDEPPLPATGVGPLVTYLRDLPVLPEAAWGPGSGVLLVDILSRLPYDLAEWDGSRWWDVRVGANRAGDGLEEVVLPAPPGTVVHLPPDPPPGRYVVAGGARRWLRRLAGSLPAGAVAALDRWSPATSPLVPGPPAPQGLPAAPEIALDQLAGVVRPDPPGIGPGAGGRSVVTWRLG